MKKVQQILVFDMKPKKIIIIVIAACRIQILCLFVLDDPVEQPTPSSLQRGCWPTSWGSCWWFSVFCCATWSPRTSTDVRRIRRKRLCRSTSRPSPRVNPQLRPDQALEGMSLASGWRFWGLRLSKEENAESSSSLYPLCCQCFI